MKNDPLQIPNLPKTEEEAGLYIRSLIPYWQKRPTSFVMQVLGMVPDAWQALAMVHVADKPPSPSALAAILDELRQAYAYEAKRAKMTLTRLARSGEPHKIEEQHEKLALAEMNLRNSESWTSDEWVLEDFEKPFRRVSVASGHGVGKSTAMSLVCIWAASCFYPLKGGATAPTSHQLKNVLWSEVYKWYDRLPAWFQKQFNVLLGDLRIESANKPELSFIVGRTARKEQPEALQGLHQKNTLVLIDECSGVHDSVIESSEGIMTARNTRAMIGSNCTRSDGFFFQTQTELREFYYCITVNCEDWIPRVSADYIASCKARYGEDSNSYRVRVLGKFPRGDDDACVPRHTVDDAIGREVETYPSAAIVWGVDPAYMGDDRTALSVRKGNKKVGKTIWWTKQNTSATAGRIIKMYWDTPERSRPDDIVVDVNGYGAGVADLLLDAGLPCTPTNTMESPIQPERFPKLYDELWWACREWFEAADCSIPDEPDFIKEICRPRYKPLHNGQTQVERKVKVKERVRERQSPDLAESFVLTFRSSRAGRMHRVRRHRPLQRRPINPLGASHAR